MEHKKSFLYVFFINRKRDFKYLNLIQDCNVIFLTIRNILKYFL